MVDGRTRRLASPWSNMHGNDPANDPDTWETTGECRSVLSGPISLAEVDWWVIHAKAAVSTPRVAAYIPGEQCVMGLAEARELARLILRACDEAEEAARG